MSILKTRYMYCDKHYCGHVNKLIKSTYLISSNLSRCESSEGRSQKSDHRSWIFNNMINYDLWHFSVCPIARSKQNSIVYYSIFQEVRFLVDSKDRDWVTHVWLIFKSPTLRHISKEEKVDFNQIVPSSDGHPVTVTRQFVTMHDYSLHKSQLNVCSLSS